MRPVERARGVPYEEEHSSHLLWKGIDNGGLISAEEDDAGGAAMTFSSVVGQFLQMAPCAILQRPRCAAPLLRTTIPPSPTAIRSSSTTTMVTAAENGIHIVGGDGGN